MMMYTNHGQNNNFYIFATGVSVDFSSGVTNHIERSFVNLPPHHKMTNEHESYFLKTTEPTACVSAV